MTEAGRTGNRGNEPLRKVCGNGRPAAGDGICGVGPGTVNVMGSSVVFSMANVTRIG